MIFQLLLLFFLGILVFNVTSTPESCCFGFKLQTMYKMPDAMFWFTTFEHNFLHEPRWKLTRFKIGYISLTSPEVPDNYRDLPSGFKNDNDLPSTLVVGIIFPLPSIERRRDERKGMTSAKFHIFFRNDFNSFSLFHIYFRGFQIRSYTMVFIACGWSSEMNYTHKTDCVVRRPDHAIETVRAIG